MKHHANPRAQLHNIHPAGIDIIAIKHDLPLDAASGNGVVHAVERPQKGRFSASGRADKCGDMLGCNVDRDIVDGLFRAIKDVHILGRYFNCFGRHGSPTSFEFVAKINGKAIHREQEHQQDDDSRRRVLNKGPVDFV